MAIDIAKDPEQRRVTVTIDRPEKKNALTLDMLKELRDSVGELEADDEIRAIILTGAGDAFCAGADINEFRERLSSPISEITYGYQLILHETYRAFENCSLPVVAKVNGVAHGAGAELALACDLRTASVNAEFGYGEINIALVPPVKRLSYVLGETMMRELAYTGNTVRADEPVAAGVFNRVVNPEELDAETDELVSELVSKSPHALEKTKRVMRYAEQMPVETAREYRRMVESQSFSHPDLRESIDAFAEGRKPEYDQ